MKSVQVIVFIVFFMGISSSVWASQKIEILTGQRKFSSFEKYKQFRQSALRKSDESLTQESVQESVQESELSAFNSFISKEKHPEEFSFDPQKVKTIVVNTISPDTRKQLKQADIRAPVKNNVEEFVKSPTPLQTKSVNVFQEDLEGLLQKTAADRQDPQLYLMNKDRLRIMTLTPHEAKSP